MFKVFLKVIIVISDVMDNEALKEADEIVQFAVQKIAVKCRAEVEYHSYPTNDGRMKYELYVKENKE